MNRWRESSLAVSVVRRILRERPFFGTMSFESSRVMTWLMPHRWPSSPVRLAAIADDSRLLHTFERFFELVALAWRESRTKGRLGALPGAGARPDVQRVRLAGWFVFAAAMTHIALIGLDALTADSAGGFGWLAAVPLALVCIVRPVLFATSLALCTVMGVYAMQSSRLQGQARDLFRRTAIVHYGHVKTIGWSYKLLGPEMYERTNER